MLNLQDYLGNKVVEIINYYLRQLEYAMANVKLGQ